MSPATYSKTGTKATTAASLDKEIFGVKDPNQQLLKEAYLAYLANGRKNLAVTKTRGLVRGGGKKPWRQKGTGRARFGSSRNPIWRTGGIVFGPTGEENYTRKIPTATKRLALRQALSLAATDKKIKVLETFECKEGKVAPTVKLLEKIEVSGRTLLVVSVKDALVERATKNLPNLKVVQARYLTVYDILNAHHIVISKKSLAVISDWLSPQQAPKKQEVPHE